MCSTGRFAFTPGSCGFFVILQTSSSHCVCENACAGYLLLFFGNVPATAYLREVWQHMIKNILLKGSRGSELQGLLPPSSEGKCDRAASPRLIDFHKPCLLSTA